MWHCNDLGSSRIPFDAKPPLLTVQGSLTANAYINQIVDPYVLPFSMLIKGLRFSKTVLTTHCQSNLMAWPFKSPDLNMN